MYAYYNKNSYYKANTHEAVNISYSLLKINTKNNCKSFSNNG